MTPAERVAALQLEATRLKTRLDRMELQLAGDEDAWFHITQRMPDTVAEVTVDKVLAEARQTALALATITKTLVQLGEVGAPAASAEDELEQRRAERKAQRKNA